MYSEQTTIVEVVASNTKSTVARLEMKAEELYVAAKSGHVIRRHDVSLPENFITEHKDVDLTDAKYDESTGTYTFTFASGDVFTAVAGEYPSAETLSDGNGLPAVTSSDEGKVATVNNSGEWVASMPSSGGGVLAVHETEESAEGITTYTLDKTWQEIANAEFAVIKAGIDSDMTYDYISSVYENGRYFVGTIGEKEYASDSASGYPYYNDGK